MCSRAEDSPERGGSECFVFSETRKNSLWGLGDLAWEPTMPPQVPDLSDRLVISAKGRVI